MQITLTILKVMSFCSKHCKCLTVNALVGYFLVALPKGQLENDVAVIESPMYKEQETCFNFYYNFYVSGITDVSILTFMVDSKLA